MAEGAVKSLEINFDFVKRLISITGLQGLLSYIFSELQKIEFILVCISIKAPRP